MKFAVSLNLHAEARNKVLQSSLGWSTATTEIKPDETEPHEEAHEEEVEDLTSHSIGFQSP